MRSITLPCIALFSLGILSATLQAGGRPGAADAACDAVDLRYRSTAARIAPRELNFILFDAAAKGCLELSAKLLDKGADVRARDRFGNTALLIAARMGHTDVIDLMLQRDANVHHVNLLGSSALLRAVTGNRRKTTAQLLALDVDPNIANKKGMTPLIAAAYNGNTRILNMLLEHNADVTAKDSSGKGPLIYASGKGYLKVVKILLSYAQLDVNESYGNDLTALMWAAGHSNDVPEKDGVAIAKLLLDSGAMVNAVDNRGRSALLIAASRDHKAMIELLLSSGATNITDKQALSAVDLATDTEIHSMLNAHTWP